MNKMGLGDPDPSNYKTDLMVQMTLKIGSKETNPMTGGNVTEKPDTRNIR